MLHYMVSPSEVSTISIPDRGVLILLESANLLIPTQVVVCFSFAKFPCKQA